MGLSGLYESASARNVPDKVHTELMNKQRLEMLNSLDSFKKDPTTREYADLIEIMTTMWCDPSRKAGSCWGDDITDVLIELFSKDGHKQVRPATRLFASH